MEGNLRFKIDGASLIVRMKFISFALFYFVFEGNFQVQSPRSLYLEGEFNRVFFFCVTSLGGLYLERLIHGGAHFLEFYSILWYMYMTCIYHKFF